MIEIKVPDLGEDIEAAEVVNVLVAQGDVVKQEQPVFELETDKATFELPCPHAGRVIRVHVGPGDEVRIGQVVLTLEELEQTAGEGAGDAGSTKVDVPRRPPVETAAAGPRPQEESPEPTTSKADALPTGPVPKRDSGARLAAFAGPATRQLARERGVALDDVKGTGPGGRVTDEDVRTAAPARDAAPPAAQEPEAIAEEALVERIRMSKLMRTAAVRLAEAWRTIPHVTQHEDVDFTELETARQVYQKRRGADDPRVTVTVLLIKGLLAALRAHPRFNASIDADQGEILLKKHYSIGVAVDTEHGLLVPVLHHADRLSTRQLADELAQLVRRAQRRELTREDLRGATFSISNQGGLGGTAFTPIINPPEVSILGVSRTRREQRPDGSTRLILPVSLSYDHRIINGADAVRFLGTLARALQSPLDLLMES